MQALTTLLQPRRFLLLAGTLLTLIGLAGVTGLLGSISQATLFNPPYWINSVHLSFGIRSGSTISDGRVGGSSA